MPKPVRIVKAENQAEPSEAPAAEGPAPPPAQDLGRQSIQAALDRSQPALVREPTSAERSADFAAQVRARGASATTKDGMPAPKRQASVARLQFASAAFRHHDYVTEFGTSFEDLLNPSYWANIASRLSAWDQITVRAEEGTFYAELIVTEVTQLSARVVAKPGSPFTVMVAEPGVDASVPAGHGVKWLGEHKKWGALRGDVCIKDGFTNQALAVTWLQNVARAR